MAFVYTVRGDTMRTVFTGTVPVLRLFLWIEHTLHF